MITEDDKLEIFEDFRTDSELPKFRKAVEIDTDAVTSGVMVSVRSGAPLNFMRNPVMGMSTGRERPFHVRVWRALVDLFQRKIVQTMPIPEFFKYVKDSVEVLEIVEKRAEGYELKFLRARQSGQIALAEKLALGLMVARTEARLYATNRRKYVSEESIIKFVKKAKRGLRLDYLRNFTRPIPDELVMLKTAADEEGLFDNYVVLHYDPQAKSWAETHQETEARKDPILFGLVGGSRKLYYVGDWVDEFCNLTLDQLADIAGKGAVQELE